MGYRNVYISNPAKLHISNGQLIAESEDAKIDIPAEDIDALLLESERSTITVAALSRLATEKVAVYICDDKHLPCAVILPYSQHSRQLRIESIQIGASKSLYKQLWKAIVKRKIKNQAIVLDAVGEEQVAKHLVDLSVNVKSGDKDNIEAFAALKYFTALFGDDFGRRDEDRINSALNYGYAILRGAIARSIATHGLLPSIGLHHRNQLNGFNLADDIIEPFRPIVDLFVFNNLYNGIETEDDSISVDEKAALLNILNADIKMDGKRYSVTDAIELVVESIVRSLDEDDICVSLPILIKPGEHTYG